MTDKDLGAAAGDIFAKAFTLGYETGRLTPAGGMALTAEQVEDVRALVWLDGRRNFDAFYLLRALFPATEPAEPVVPNPEHPYFVWEQGYQAAVTDSDAGVDGTRGNAYTSNPYSLGESEPDLAAEPAEARGKTREELLSEKVEHLQAQVKHLSRIAVNAAEHGIPAPAEPAEEETKAETRPPLLTPNQIRDANPGKHETFIFGQQRADGTACVGCSWQTYEVLDTIHAVAEHDDAKGLVHDHAVWITKNGICPCGQPASSPVVPAPTETGPWQDISEAPKHLTLIDRVGDKWTYDGDNWVTPETAILPVLYINRKYAPFVAAKEG